MSDLAILGGAPAVASPLNPYRAIDEDDRAAVDAVMRSGVLSGYIGEWCDAFYGGPVVRDFEAQFAGQLTARHAVAVNSNTSGMIAAMGAVGVSPGDEVIVPPTTMSATAMAPLIYGGIPVFVDIEQDTFCLDLEQTRSAITPKTRAILAVNLFGHPARLAELRQLADQHGLYLIEDNAQAPLAAEHGRYTGTIGHIGVFSLNYHKHIHTGEGGVCTTDDGDLAERLQMIRNHGENVADRLAKGNYANLVGFNLRLTEMQAAIGISQLRKAERLVARREAIANRITNALAGLPGLTCPPVRDGCRHVYYVWVARYDAAKTGVSRSLVVKALKAEGIPVSSGYVQPLYMLPLFQKRIAIGRQGFPFSLTNRSYPHGLCPVAERLHQQEILELAVCSWQLDDDEVDAVVNGFRKVFNQINELRELAA